MHIDLSLAIQGVICSAIGFWIGYKYGTKTTNISHASHYHGAIDKLVINGTVQTFPPNNANQPDKPSGIKND